MRIRNSIAADDPRPALPQGKDIIREALSSAGAGERCGIRDVNGRQPRSQRAELWRESVTGEVQHGFSFFMAVFYRRRMAITIVFLLRRLLFFDIIRYTNEMDWAAPGRRKTAIIHLSFQMPPLQSLPA